MPHIHDEYDFTVAAIIVHDGKVLLVKHPRYGMWLAPGGHIELNEDPETALYREIEEETGLQATLITPTPAIRTLEAKVLPLPDYMDVHTAGEGHKHINFVYYMRAESNKAVLSEEHDELRWVGDDELDDPELDLLPEVKHNIREAIQLAAVA